MNLISLHPCPDCGAEFTKNKLTHEKTCPIAADLDAAMDADRDWFATHPNATEYHRAPNVADMDDMRRALPNLPEGGKWAGRIRVVQVEPGIRYRDFSRMEYITP